MENCLAKHIMVEFHGASFDILNNKEVLEREIVASIHKSGATLIHHFFHEFTPHGITGVVVIAESHLNIHTWPEFGSALVDILTCSDTVNFQMIINNLEVLLNAKFKATKYHARGEILDQGRPLEKSHRVGVQKIFDEISPRGPGGIFCEREK